MRLLGVVALGGPWFTATLVALGWALWMAAAFATGMLLGVAYLRSAGHL